MQRILPGYDTCVSHVHCTLPLCAHRWWRASLTPHCTLPPLHPQVVERILLGYDMACASAHPAAAMGAGEDPLVRPTSGAAASAAAAAGAGAGGSGGALTRRRASSSSTPLELLRKLVLTPLPAAAAAGKGRRGRGGRKSGGAGGRRGGGGSGGGCSCGMLVVVLDELDHLLSGGGWGGDMVDVGGPPAVRCVGE